MTFRYNETTTAGIEYTTHFFFFVYHYFDMETVGSRNSWDVRYGENGMVYYNLNNEKLQIHEISSFHLHNTCLHESKGINFCIDV